MSQLKNDWTTKVLLLGITGLLAANLVVISGVGMPRTARAAGIPDSGAQLEALIDQVKGVNDRLDTMEKYMESGRMTVLTKAEAKDK